MTKSLVLIVGGGLLQFVASFSPPQTSVFVSELHYENVGTDLGEGVEVCGPAGSDLTEWTIQLYDGDDGVLYKIWELEGELEDQCNNHGCMAIYDLPSNSIENGSPDGLALVDNGGDVVQFLSYEGIFEAIDGAAMGLISTDIGIQEKPGTPVGTSLQLTGDGQYYKDFTWTRHVTQSFGDVNAAMTFNGACSPTPAPTPAPTLSPIPAPTPASTPYFVSELHYDNDGSDVAVSCATDHMLNDSSNTTYGMPLCHAEEGVEVCGPAGSDLTEWTIQLYDGDSGVLYDILQLNGQLWDQCNGYGCMAIYDLPFDRIENGSPDGLALVDGAGDVVQFLSYEGIFEAIDGAAMGLISTDIGIQENPGTPVGTSLQLTGDGTSYEDFTWTAHVTQSFGDVNANMTFNGPCP